MNYRLETLAGRPILYNGRNTLAICADPTRPGSFAAGFTEVVRSAKVVAQEAGETLRALAATKLGVRPIDLTWSKRSTISKT